MQLRLLGYDARENYIDAAQNWSASRRQRYLLLLNAPKPLSVDVYVWPNMFGRGNPGAPQLALPGGWLDPAWPFWNDCRTLSTYLEGRTNKRYRLVQVSVALPSSREVAWPWDADDGGVVAAPLGSPWQQIKPVEQADHAGWTTLGYDVACASLQSGLMNCGYRDEEAMVLRARWASRLNQHHLFRHYGDAAEYSLATNARVPEHAPFFVYLIASRNSEPHK
jgi:hypothetical protein